MVRRGSYAKGDAKREEILERSLSVIADQGFKGTSVKALAEAVGLSKAGLLHYFDSKEELFAEIIRKRDEVDMRRFENDDQSFDTLKNHYVELISYNSDVPGLVQLFSYVAVQAADPDDPAHEYFVERTDAYRALFADILGQEQAAGRVTDRIPPEDLARILQAVTDGLQLQWMIDPNVDMSGIVRSLLSALEVEGK